MSEIKIGGNLIELGRFTMGLMLEKEAAGDEGAKAMVAIFGAIVDCNGQGELDVELTNAISQAFSGHRVDDILRSVMFLLPEVVFESEPAPRSGGCDN